MSSLNSSEGIHLTFQPYTKTLAGGELSKIAEVSPPLKAPRSKRLPVGLLHQVATWPMYGHVTQIRHVQIAEDD